MSDDFPPPSGGDHLRTVALPRHANASGDIFGVWTLSQMDRAGGTFAAAHPGKRVVMVRIETVEFLRPVAVGDDVSVSCHLEDQENTSIAVHIEAWARERKSGGAHKSRKRLHLRLR